MRRERLVKTAKRIYLMLIFSETVPTAQYYAAGSNRRRPSAGTGVQMLDPAESPPHSRGTGCLQRSGQLCLTFQLDLYQKAQGRQI